MLRANGARWALPLAVGVLALAVRLTSLLRAGGLDALLGYDEGVYMGAATALAHGLVPYRDFVLVHPPGSALLLAPFAALGHATSEPTSWAVARLFVVAVGSTNAALVTVVAGRISVVAAVTAGVLYAVWGPAVHVERTTMLEAFVLLALVVALVAVRRPDDSLTRVLVAGSALGLGTSVKLWGAVAVVVFVAWLAVHRAWRSVLAIAVSAGTAFAAVVLPFVAVAGDRVFRLTVLAQLARGHGGTPVADRPGLMLSLGPATEPFRHVAVFLVAVGVLGLVLAAALKRPMSRLWVALLGAQTLVLLVVPVYFIGYSSFIGIALALCAGAGVDVAFRDIPVSIVRHLGFALVGAIVAVLAMGGLAVAMSDRGLIPGPDPRIAAATASARCVGSDSTGMLLMYGVLGRNVDRGCPTLIDVDGTLYGVDPSNPSHATATQRRRSSAAYQRILRDYFASSDVVLIHRAAADAMSPSTRRVLDSKTTVITSRGLVLYALATTSPLAGQ